MMLDAIIVGAGLFGQVIAAAMRKQGREVLVLDSAKKEAGSKPAACIMRPGWYKSLGDDVSQTGMELLDSIYGIKGISFEFRGKKVTQPNTVYWIPPKKILSGKKTKTEVLGVQKGGVMVEDGLIPARLVVVAAGIWTEKLLPQYKQRGQKGVALLWRNEKIEQPFIQPYAPYKQLMVFNRGDGLWAGDGTAIMTEHWTEARVEAMKNRAWEHIGGKAREIEPSILLGVRPYPGKKYPNPCIVEEVEPGLWVATGGAKNGTILAGYAAHRILEATS